MRISHACLTSSALDSLANQASKLSTAAVELWVASAFVSSDALGDITQPLVTRGKAVRFLTGTFGNATRKRTFQRMLTLHQQHPEFEPRVWTWRTGQFHAKVYLWKLGREGVAWVGSANLTAGGMANEGEIVLELRAPWDGPQMRSVRLAFEHEWRRGVPITEQFVRNYRQSRRAPPDARVSRRMRRTPAAARGAGRFFTTSVAYHFPERSPVTARIEPKLGYIDDGFMRHNARSLATIRAGDRCLIVDLVDKSALVAMVTATCRDGRRWAFAYSPIGRSIEWSKAAREALRRAGGVLTPRGGVRTRWLDLALTQVVERAFAKVRQGQRKP